MGQEEEIKTMIEWGTELNHVPTRDIRLPRADNGLRQQS